MKTLLIALLLSLGLHSLLPAQSKELPLHAGDQISLQISGIPPEEVAQISHGYRISGDGMINLLYLDDVQAAGMTASELERKIAQLYKSKEYYTHPNVTVSVDGGTKDGGGRVVYVAGEVKNPNPVSFRPGMTVGKAITTAGGPTPFARMSKVTLKRNGIRFKELNLSKSNSKDGDTPVEPEDEIIVPN